jgi:hypothetical protein
VDISAIIALPLFLPFSLSHTVFLSPPTSRPSSASAVETNPRSRAPTINSRLTHWKNLPPYKMAPLFGGQRVSRCSRPIVARGRRFGSPIDETPSRPWGSTHSASALAASRQIWSSRREKSATMVPSPWGTCTLTSRPTSECLSYRLVRPAQDRLRLTLRVAPPTTTMKLTVPSSRLSLWEWWGTATDQ